MPGAWEIGFGEVLVATLTREMVSTAWAKSHREMRLPPGNKIIYLSGMPFDHARNAAVQMMLTENFRYLFFVDDDVMIPPDAYAILRSNNLDIVSGLYYRRAEPIMPVALVKDRNGKREWLSSLRYGDVIPVYMTGAGCLLVRRKVFEIVPPPWFEWMSDRPDVPQEDRTSEDFTFCRKAKDQFGITTYLDTRVQCVHSGMSRVTADGKLTPMAYT
jgi:hypothetical protein